MAECVFGIDPPNNQPQLVRMLKRLLFRRLDLRVSPLGFGMFFFQTKTRGQKIREDKATSWAPTVVLNRGL